MVPLWYESPLTYSIGGRTRTHTPLREPDFDSSLHFFLAILRSSTVRMNFREHQLSTRFVNALRANRTKVQAKNLLSYDASSPSLCHPVHDK